MTARRTRRQRLHAWLRKQLDGVPTFYRDALERVAWTFLQAAAGATTDELTSGHLTWRTIAYTGAAAVIKAGLARKVGSPDSAAIAPGP